MTWNGNGTGCTSDSVGLASVTVVGLVSVTVVGPASAMVVGPASGTVASCEVEDSGDGNAAEGSDEEVGNGNDV